MIPEYNLTLTIYETATIEAVVISSTIIHDWEEMCGNLRFKQSPLALDGPYQIKMCWSVMPKSS